jgi:hypothetical protein
VSVGERNDKSFTSVTPIHLIVPWLAFEMHFMGRGESAKDDLRLLRTSAAPLCSR